jgi:hypothetical protein
MANMLFWGACEQAGYVAILSSISMEDVRKLFPWESLPHWVGFSEHEKVKFHHFLVILLWCNVLSSGICLEYVEGERNLIIACLPWARGACSPQVDLSYFLIGESWLSKSVFPWWTIWQTHWLNQQLVKVWPFFNEVCSSLVICVTVCLLPIKGRLFRDRRKSGNLRELQSYLSNFGAFRWPSSQSTNVWSLPKTFTARGHNWVNIFMLLRGAGLFKNANGVMGTLYWFLQT